MNSDILHRFSGRIVLSLLLAAVFLSNVLSPYLGDRELLFIATIAAVYLFWMPMRYLLSVAVGLLFLAALLFMPLEEDYSEKLLRFVYYILILVVSRELLSSILAPFRFSRSVRATVARLEFYHYRSVAWILRKSILTFRSVSAVFVWYLTTYAKLYKDWLQKAGIFWKRYIVSRMPSLLIRVMRGAEYVSTPIRLVLKVRLIFFALLTALVVLPWFLQPGYLFLLDYVWPPSLPTPQLQSGFITSLPHEWIFWLASHIIPTHIVQKVVFALPILLAGLSASHLVSWILKEENSRAQPLLASLIAGTFYVLNPFVVSRIFMGQAYFMLAYALVPWAVLATLQFLKRSTIHNGLIAGLSIVGVMISNAHHIILLPLVLIPLFIRPVIYRRLLVRRYIIFVAPVALFAGLFFVVRTEVSTSPSSLDPQGPWARLLQAPFSENLWIDIMFLTAHWKTDLLFAFPYELLTHFSLFVIFLMILMGAGVWHLWQHRTEHSWLVWQLLGIAAVSIFLAGGVSHPFSEPVAGWLYRHVPFWIGMRDSAKFIANLALIETLLLGLGIAALRRVNPARQLISGVMLIVMLWFVSPAYAGFSGQVLPIKYPESWQQWNDTVGQHQHKPKMLALPWHMYPRLAWLENRPVINPAAHFFTNAEAIVGDNSEVGGIGESKIIFSESRRPFSKKIERTLEQRGEVENFGSMLARDSITYVALLADAVDIDKYQFLYRQEDLELIFKSSELVVWRNTAL